MKKLFKILKLSSFAIATIVIVSCNKDDNSPVAAASCLPTNLQNGVIAAYTFGNGSLNDSSGNGYHLTNTTTASPGADRAGNSNCAFHFTEANNEFLIYSNATFLDNIQSQPFSISLWYKNESLDPNKFEILMGKNTNTPIGQFYVGLHDVRRPVFSIDGNYAWAIGNPQDQYTTPQWRHLGLVFDGSFLQIYIDGVFNIQYLKLPAIFNFNGIPGNIGDLFLGKKYDGFLDDIVIYNRNLSQTEITQLYNLPACCV
ncbi:LamG domain-containing protein [Flavobacterium sp. I3-2]|uniref:LamG domain-containing protein n=1 Tax=Flavobacterium sp. I3-2 TaxID=2748319 RepID=UPI0015AA6D75|nr:LamG domain-containing protein [Flavobacterium sp. I3-2]